MPDEKYRACCIERVARMRTSLLKYGSAGLVHASSESESAKDELASSSKPCARSAWLRPSKAPGGGGGWRRRIACWGKACAICLATVMLARSINSSTIELASLRLYIATSVGSRVSESSTKRTCGETRGRAVVSTCMTRAAGLRVEHGSAPRGTRGRGHRSPPASP